MVRSKRIVPTRRTRRSAAKGGGNAEPNIYQQMLAEAEAEAEVSLSARGSPERPLKRRRHGARPAPISRRNSSPDQKHSPPCPTGSDDDEEEDEDIEFQDVLLPAPTVQTMELDSDEDEAGDVDDEGMLFEDVDFTATLADAVTSSEQNRSLELNLTAQKAAVSPVNRQRERRKPISKEERERRSDIHKAHLVCLLSHVSRRNHWCNDLRVQDALRPHLSAKTVNFLTPGLHLSQFGQSESLKTGLKESIDMWKTKFVITERGIRRALWAEDVDQLQHYAPPVDMDSCLDCAEFREASKRLQGSRDAGAQLYCAMLRSIGVQARLVCSLQPLACVSGAPMLPRSKPTKSGSKVTQKQRTQDAMAQYEALATSMSTSAGKPRTPSARRRLGHPNATAYNLQPKPTASTSSARTYTSPARICESAHPIYWVEVLDVGHQKWQPIDPVVTHTFWKPKVFEPPLTDKENCLSYVVAFEVDSTAKDVTRRYAKAYIAKTRRLRVETVLGDNGEWWRKAMKPFRRRKATDLDQIEDNELAGLEAREPMPKNVQDFKDHPVYALERHLRRHEVLVPDARPSGTISVGNRGPQEKIYRKKDVRVGRSVDKWYRMGRVVKFNEIPAKWLPGRTRPKDMRCDDGEAAQEDDAGVPIYTLEQTELYEPPPVRNGRVPKNKFGNIDAYVPSMIPKGCVHITHEYAARAAFIVGVDYAPALTGFSFKGRHGTAVLNGIIVAEEFQEAIWATVEGMADVEQEMEDERRSLASLKMWRKFLRSLRIRDRIWSGVSEEEEERKEEDLEAELANAGSDATEEMAVAFDDEGGGGFLLED